MKNTIQKKVGRPSKLMDEAIIQVLFILDISGALSLRQMGRLEDLGFATKEAALDFIKKRRRGLTGALLGDAVKLAHRPCKRTEAALRCIAEDGMPVALVARYFELDRRNLVRALPRYRKIFAEKSAAVAKVAVSAVK